MSCPTTTLHNIKEIKTKSIKLSTCTCIETHYIDNSGTTIFITDSFVDDT